MMNLNTGHLLAGGRYRVERVLGTGGFGITYLCEQTGLGRKVAVKEFFMREYCEREHDTATITLGSSGSRGMVDRFRQKFIKEARALATLNHKHIVRIIDIFEENNTAYYVMEFVDGGSLSDKVKSGALPEATAVRYIRQIASALDFVHGKRMMHLDVKPANILLNENDETVLIDFGLAKQYDESGTQTSTTPVGISHGYAPLEQYKRGGVGTFSPATDIYSLGATLYKLLTGETPPEAGDVMNEGLPQLPVGISETVRKAVETAMQPAVRNRPQNIGEFLSLLDKNVKAESGKVKTESNDDGATEILHSVQDDKYREKNSSTKLGEVPQAEGYNPNRASAISTERSGREISNTDDGATVVAGSVADNDNPHPAEKKQRPSAKKRTAIIIAALLCIVVVVFFVFGGNDKNDNAIGTINGHEYVDLGLSVKWATCNVGASSPGDYGRHYAWGETTTKGDYTQSTSTTSGKQMTCIAGNSTYDVACREWGGTWRLPTDKEFHELIDNCTWIWTTQDGHNGYKVTSKKNGNSIFLPAAGWRSGTSLGGQGTLGYYWSATPGGSNSNYAYNLRFYDGSLDVYWYSRYNGRSVRPVRE